MKRFIWMVAFAASLATHAFAQDAAPVVIGAQGAWFVGAPDKPGPYLFRVRLAAGARIPPHTHPDERSTTVMSGTILVGFGEASYQESGVGPSATNMIRK